VPGLDCYQVDVKVWSLLKPRLLRVELANGHSMLAHVTLRSGLDTARLKAGDTVRVEVTAFDLSHAKVLGWSE
jgi:translation initiation factor IF-1